LFYTDGINTVAKFAAIYATVTMEFTNQEMILLFLVMNIIAFPGALVSGHLADAIGAKRTIILTLVLWIGVVLMAGFGTSKALFWAMASAAAIGMGSTQAVGRSFMAQLAPPSRQSEFFGFYVLSGKFASMFGPLLFGTISHWSGSQRAAVLSLLPFFVLGLGFMVWIDERRAHDAVLEESATGLVLGHEAGG
jgi:UMF1 family MFS transporter